MGFVDFFNFCMGAAERFGDGVWSVVGGVIGWVVGAVADMLLVLSSGLPDNILTLPGVIADWETGMHWLNWFVPVRQIRLLLEAWVAATFSFYMGRYVFTFVSKRVSGGAS